VHRGRNGALVELVALIPPLRGPTRKNRAKEKSGRSGRDDRLEKVPVSDGDLKLPLRSGGGRNIIAGGFGE